MPLHPRAQRLPPTPTTDGPHPTPGPTPDGGRSRPRRPGTGLTPTRALAPRGLEVLVLVLATLVAYAPSFRGVMLLDDGRAINASALRGLRWPWEYFVHPRGLADLTFALNHALLGPDLWGYHLVNLAIHIAAGLTLLGILRQTLALPRFALARPAPPDWFAPAIALLWLVHPLQTQAVTYLIQRAESLMGLCYLLTLYATIRAAGAQASPDPAGRGRARPWATLAVVACFAGMASKQVMVTAPLAVLLFDRLLLADSWRDLLRRRLPLYLGLAASWLWLAWLMGGGRGLVAAPGGGAGLGLQEVHALDYARTQPGVILHYLRLIVCPTGLCLDHDWPIARGWSDAFIPLAIVGSALAATLVLLLRGRASGLVAALFFLILLPTTSFVPIAEACVEHRIYLPLAPALVILVFVAWRLAATVAPSLASSASWSLRLFATALGVAALALGSATFLRNLDYTDAQRIWAQVVRAYPNSVRARTHLGAALMARGQADQARAQFEAAIALDPAAKQAAPRLNMGGLSLLLGQPQTAMRYFQEAERIEPGSPAALNGRGTVLAQLGQTDEAIALFRQAIIRDPALALAHVNLGNALASRGQLLDALQSFTCAMELDASDAVLFADVGRILAQAGRVDDAIRYYQQALQRNPNLAIAHNGLAVALATRGDLVLAREHFAAAARIEPANPLYLENLRRAQGP